MAKLQLQKDHINQHKSGLMEAYVRAAKDTETKVRLTVSGSYLHGTITGMDQFTLLVFSDNANNLIFKSAISQVVPDSDFNDEEKLQSFNNRLKSYMDEHVPSKNNRPHIDKSKIRRLKK